MEHSIFHLKLIASYYYSMRGCVSNGGVFCGIFFTGLSNSYNATYWSNGTALYIHIILFVVGLLALVPLVVYFMFLFTMLFLVLIGFVVLLYIYTLCYAW